MALHAELRIEPLAHHLDLASLVARWHWDEWGRADPLGSAERWADRLRQRANPERIPITWVAFYQGVPIGSVALIENDMAARADLSPWMSGLFVVPAYRQRGIGNSLVRYCENAAQGLDVDPLFLYASSGEKFFLRLGYQVLERTFWEGEDVAILSKRLGPPVSD
jgi:predicted N-acetyltransferase YhbS